MAAKKKKKLPNEMTALYSMVTKPFRSPQGTATINRNAQKQMAESSANTGQPRKRRGY